MVAHLDEQREWRDEQRPEARDAVEKVHVVQPNGRSIQSPAAAAHGHRHTGLWEGSLAQRTTTAAASRAAHEAKT
jgi:hypothetical protein